MIKDENFKAKDPKEEASCQYTLKKTAKKAAKKPLGMKQAAKKTPKKADIPRSLQLKNSSQEASSQEDPKEGSQETSSQETSSLFARFLHAFWTLLHAFFGSRRANPLQETKRFVYSLSSS